MTCSISKCFGALGYSSDGKPRMGILDPFPSFACIVGECKSLRLFANDERRYGHDSRNDLCKGRD